MKKKSEKIVASFLERKYRQQLSEVKIIGRMDLDKIEHMTGEWVFCWECDLDRPPFSSCSSTTSAI